MSKDYSNNNSGFSQITPEKLLASSSVAKEFLEKNGDKINGEYLELLVPDAELGQELHTTGKVVVGTTGLYGKKVVWVALETIEKVWIPLHTLLGIKSMTGYFTQGEFVSESIKRRIGKAQEIYEAKVVSDFDFSKVYQPSYRVLADFIADADVNQLFKDCILRYLGTVIKPYEAKKDSSESSVDKYYKGMKRIMTKYLWEVRLTPEEQKKKDQTEAAERVRRQREEEQERIRRTETERREREEAIRKEKASFNQRNSHSRDRYLLFNSYSHSYSVNGIALQSVTDFVEHCFPEFNSREMAVRVASRSGQSIAEVLSMWERKGKESRDAGTEMHRKIESFYQLNNVIDDETFRLFRILANQIILNPYRTEWPVYDTATNLAGTIDFVDYSNGKYIIYDWKRSDKLIENGMPVMTSKYNQKALPPLSHLDDCAYNRYALQLSLYKYILEKNYGIEVSELRLGIFHPAYNKPYVLKIPYLKKEVETLMSLRESIIF